MLHHVSVGVRDMARAAAFYDNVLGALGYRRVMEVMPYGIAYGSGAPEFWVQLPANQNPATIGNGVHICFKATSKEAIQAFHRAAIEAGGSDEGVAGPRPDYGPDYYGAFIRDLDGNKLEACLTPAPEAAPRKSAGKAKRKTVTASAKVRPASKAKTRRKKGKAPAKKAPRKKAKRKG